MEPISGQSKPIDWIKSFLCDFWWALTLLTWSYTHSWIESSENEIKSHHPYMLVNKVLWSIEWCQGIPAGHHSWEVDLICRVMTYEMWPPKVSKSLMWWVTLWLQYWVISLVLVITESVSRTRIIVGINFIVLLLGTLFHEVTLIFFQNNNNWGILIRNFYWI